jgi:DNA-binding PadR family transcriptional regulator
MLEQGWIERVEEDEDRDNNRIRKSYRLTKLGRRILEAETERLQSLVAAAHRATQMIRLI